MAQVNVTIAGASYPSVPSITVPKTGGGTASFTEVSDTTAVASDVASGKYFYDSQGVLTEGTASGGGVIGVRDTLDVNGGTIREITAVSLQGDTVAADKLLYGYTAHDSTGTAITGSYVPITTNTQSNKNASPTESQQIIQPDDGYDNLAQVTVGAISSTYVGSDVPTLGATTYNTSSTDQTITSGKYITGTQTIKAVTYSGLSAENIKSGVTVKIGDANDDDRIASVLGTYTGGGGGGATNIVQGTFTTGATRNQAQDVSISYSGSGYPIAAMVFISGGAYNNGTGGNTTWYNSVDRYDVGVWYMTKARQDTVPGYKSTGGADNMGVTAYIYKNSTSTSTTYSRSSSMTANTYTSSSTNATSGATCCRFKGNGKTLSVYVGNKSTSTYGFPPSTLLQYIIIYSS